MNDDPKPPDESTAEPMPAPPRIRTKPASSRRPLTFAEGMAWIEAMTPEEREHATDEGRIEMPSVLFLLMLRLLSPADHALLRDVERQICRARKG
jgi:hypothetical protein